MTLPIHLDTSKRHEFILLYDCEDGNPNGDPDADNMPRTDPETQQGVVTGVCIKRKIRNYIQMWGKSWENSERYDIYMKEGVLNHTHLASFEALKIKPVKRSDPRAKDTKERTEQSRQWMCDRFADIRYFGGVMSTEINSGAVYGPFQIEFGRSYEPVFPMVAQLTRCAVTNEKDEEKERTFGRRPWIPYGLYRSYGTYTAPRAEKVGLTSEDMGHFWEAVMNMWDFDRSASRGLMALQKLVIFSHDTAKGSAPAHQLFKRLQVSKHPEVKSPRNFDHYEVHLNQENLPKGITVTELV